MKWRRKRKYRKRSPFAMKLKKQTVYTVGAVWLWLFAGVVALSFFVDGAVLVGLRDQLAARIGWCYYLLPLFLVSVSLLFFKLKAGFGKPNVPLGFFLILVALAGISQSGSWGGALQKSVADAISLEGSVLLFLGVLVIGCIVLFNASLDGIVNFILIGLQAIADWIGVIGKRLFTRKEKTFLDGEKQQVRIRGGEDRQIAKQPITPPPVPSRATVSMAQLPIGSMANAPEEMKLWEFPPVGLLSEGPGNKADRGNVNQNANTIEKTLDSFGITAKVAEVNRGPAVTQYAIKIALGTKVSKITALSSDLALALAAPTGQVRIEAPIPGKDMVGIEIPNRGLEFVTLKQMLQSEAVQKAKSKLTVALGLDVSGNPIVTDIGRMPHVLVAGTTGSGKSVLINSFICSFLFRTTPQEVRLILVDPKRVELIGYNGIPHLLTPVIVETDKILSALHWAINQMEQRYKQFAEVGVRNIDGFNELSGFQAMPYIVIFIDELADLMAYAPADVEDSICRLAQMARATGIHLVVSTQRPSIEVITGLIKANIPCRIAFNVSSMVDSRVIIDMPGAEKLLGRGDMLYVPPDQSKPSRIQGTYVSEHEVVKVVDFLKNKNIPLNYSEEVTSQPAGKASTMVVGREGEDALFEDALRLVCQYDKASASLLQRRLSVGYARAARILDQLEAEGIISQAEGSKPRDVLIKDPESFLMQHNQE